MFYQLLWGSMIHSLDDEFEHLVLVDATSDNGSDTEIDQWCLEQYGAGNYHLQISYDNSSGKWYYVVSLKTSEDLFIFNLSWG